MKKTKYFLALLAAVMILTAGVGQAMAYFTTYTEAKGYKTIRLGDETEIEEDFKDWVKDLTIKNAEGSQPVFVRAKVFAPDTLTITCPYTGSDPEWREQSKEDGYYYYNKVLPAGGTAGVLKIHISDLPKDPALGDKFNVIVVYESTPVLYDVNGDPYADWNSKLVIVGTTEGRPDTEGTVELEKEEDN